jgi:hypothetical protein
VVEAVRREGGRDVLAGFKDLGTQAVRGYRKPLNLWGLSADSLGVD